MSSPVSLFGFGGSLRQHSFNQALLNTAQQLAPKNSNLHLYSDLNKLPLFNQDYQANQPQVVKDFKRQLESADAVLIATPEYNYSVPGYLKNALDWASRPYGHSSLKNKPVAIMSASTGQFGGVRAQLHLRQVLLSLRAQTLTSTQVFVGHAARKIDQDQVIDPETKAKISQLLQALVDWTNKLQS